MELTLNLRPEAQDRLRHQAELSGISAEDAARQATAIAKEPERNAMMLAGLFLLMFLLSQPVPAELKQELNAAVREFIYGLLKTGDEEQLAALLPKMPSVEAPFYETATPEEWNQDFIAWAESHRDLPNLPQEAFTRQYHYEDHD